MLLCLSDTVISAFYQEISSSLGALGYVDNTVSHGQSILHNNTTLTEPSPYDRKFIKMLIQSNYKPKEMLDDILGL